MKRRIFLALCLLTVVGSARGQEVNFIRDSLIDHYFSSGKANTLFVPEGKYDKQGCMNGFWKYYYADEDNVMVSTPDAPAPIPGSYLKYAEGKFVRNVPQGKWKFYLIEDRTFRKVLFKEGNFKNGKAVGKAYHYFPSGAIAAEFEAKDGLTHGVSKTYYETGELYSTTNYIENNRTGKCYHYRKNGNLKLEMEYARDTMNGDLRSYYPDGTLQESLTYKNGKPDGIYHYYHPNGKLWIEKEYRENKLWNITGSYDDQGNPRDKGTIVDGNGTAKYYNQDGVIYAIYTYKDGEIVDEQNFDVPAKFRE